MKNLNGYEEGFYDVEYQDMLTKIKEENGVTGDPSVDSHWIFDDFNKMIYNSSFNHVDGESYRYGSYLFFETNNVTKSFKIANFINTTS
jgi:hypothetical protein